MASVIYGWSYDRPFIPIVVTNPVSNTQLMVSALIDTGADNCLFPGSLALALGFDLKNGQPFATNGIGNIQNHCWLHDCQVSILSADKKSIVKKLPVVPIAFSDDTPECNSVPPLLGTSNFLKHFTLQIFYKQQSTMLIY
jgi:hypothetical protein